MLTDQQPSSTKIFLLDVMMNASPHKLLVYTNNLEIEPKTNKGPVPEWGNKWVNMNNPNTYFGKEFINRRGNALMIIPIPNPFKVTNFGLVDTSTALMKQFTQQVVKSCNNLKDYPPEGDNYAVLRASKPIPIQKVGKYEISVAYNLHDLKHSIDWSHFTLPENIKDRYKTFSNKEFYPFPCAYVVAKAVENISDDGFGVIYPDPEFHYIPTVRENINKETKFDLDVYLFTHKMFTRMNFNGFKASNYHLDEGNTRTLVRLLPGNCVMSDTGNNNFFKVDYSKTKFINYCPLNNIINKNQNITFKY